MELALALVEGHGLWKQRASHTTKPHGAKPEPGVLSCVRANCGPSPRHDWGVRKPSIWWAFVPGQEVPKVGVTSESPHEAGIQHVLCLQLPRALVP